MKSFYINRKYIEHEFEEAHFDEGTGLCAEILKKELDDMQNRPHIEDREAFCAEAYAYLLRNMQLEINEHTPFSVKFNLGIDYGGFAGIDIFDKAIFRTQREKILSEKVPDGYTRMIDSAAAGVGDVYTDFWHTVPNWDNLIKKGFAGILYDAEKSKEKHLKTGDERAVKFLTSVIIRYRVILECLERIYDYSLRFEVSDFSRAVKNLISSPPGGLYEVMLFSVLYLYFEEIGCERGRTLGPVDRLYYPFFESELKSGKSVEEIKELFRYFFIHFTATKRFAQQPLLIGGSDADGSDRTNVLSHLILDVYDELKIYDPKIHLRYHKNIDRSLLIKALSMIRRGHSSICIVNDEAVYSGYEKLGVSRFDAQNYVLLGCYEPVIMGLEEPEVGVSWINMAKSVEFVLFGGVDVGTGKRIGVNTPLDYSSFEELFDGFLLQLDGCVDFAIDFAERQSEYNILINPSPIYSSAFTDCIEKGRDVHEYPLKYNHMSLKCFGLATVVDSLCVIKSFVFDNQYLSLSKLREILLANWQGYDEMRQKILTSKEKYGNGREIPDSLMRRITEHLEDKYCGKKDRNGRKIRLGLDSIDWHIYDGRKTCATPDGRFCGSPVSRNLTPTAGMDKAGITGYMQSVLKINSAAFLDSAIFDFTLHPSAVEGEKGLLDFTSLIEIFFANGGFAAQGNILNGDSLKRAQISPEEYRTLQIRVCGWNEYFVKLSKEKQNYFISLFSGEK